MYVTGKRYAKFIGTDVIKKVVQKLDNLLNVTSQDNQDQSGDWRQIASDSVRHILINRIEPISSVANWMMLHP